MRPLRPAARSGNVVIGMWQIEHSFSMSAADAVASALMEVRRLPPERRYAERMSRYRHLGLALE